MMLGFPHLKIEMWGTQVPLLSERRESQILHRVQGDKP
jgi:hypothetical protein